MMPKKNGKNSGKVMNAPDLVEPLLRGRSSSEESDTEDLLDFDVAFGKNTTPSLSTNEVEDQKRMWDDDLPDYEEEEWESYPRIEQKVFVTQIKHIIGKMNRENEKQALQELHQYIRPSLYDIKQREPDRETLADALDQILKDKRNAKIYKKEEEAGIRLLKANIVLSTNSAAIVYKFIANEISETNVVSEIEDGLREIEVNGFHNIQEQKTRFVDQCLLNAQPALQNKVRDYAISKGYVKSIVRHDVGKVAEKTTKAAAGVAQSAAAVTSNVKNRAIRNTEAAADYIRSKLASSTKSKASGNPVFKEESRKFESPAKEKESIRKPKT